MTASPREMRQSSGKSKCDWFALLALLFVFVGYRINYGSLRCLLRNLSNSGYANSHLKPPHVLVRPAITLAILPCAIPKARAAAI